MKNLDLRERVTSIPLEYIITYRLSTNHFTSASDQRRRLGDYLDQDRRGNCIQTLRRAEISILNANTVHDGLVRGVHANSLVCNLG